MSTLITPEELARIELLRMSRKDDESVLWLCDTVMRLARLKPTEESFPERAALINRQNYMAYALRLSGRIAIDETVTARGRVEQLVALDYAVKCKKLEAVLLARPYLKLVSPRSEEVLERLGRTGRIRLTVNGTALVEDGSLDDILVALDGYGVRRQPYTISAGVERSGLYDVGTFDRSEAGTLYDLPTAIPTGKGVFLVDGDRVKLELGPIRDEGTDVVLVAGLVMALYTTEGVSNLVRKVQE